MNTRKQSNSGSRGRRKQTQVNTSEGIDRYFNIRTRSQTLSEAELDSTMADKQELTLLDLKTFMETSTAATKKLIADNHSDLCLKLERVKSDIQEKIDEVKTDVTHLKTTVKEHTESLNFVSNKLSDVENNIPELEQRLNKKIQFLEEQLQYQELRSRKYNLTFYNIPTVSAKSSRDYSKILQKFFAEKMDIDPGIASQIIIANAHPIQYDSEKYSVPPVIAKFAIMEQRELVLSNAYKLKGTTYSVVTDLPNRMKAERYKLARAAFELRKGGYETRIRIRGLEVFGHYREKVDDPDAEKKEWIKM